MVCGLEQIFIPRSPKYILEEEGLNRIGKARNVKLGAATEIARKQV
jgi:hypothetical protein